MPSRTLLLLAAAGISGASPFLLARDGGTAGAAAASPPAWPAAYEGRKLTPLPLSAREHAFAEGFPGQIGRFTDGSRELVLRHVREATRRLHPASDCYKGLGFEIEPRPLRHDTNGRPLGCFSARKDNLRQIVCEGLHDADGKVWSDVSQWYWDALLGRSRGPWWSVVIAQADVARP
jgi:hypothetical protein